MANEITVRTGLTVNVVNGSKVLVDYQSRPVGFNADMAGAYGPAIGEVIVPTTGLSIDFAASLGSDEPGLAFIFNQDPTNYVTVGIKDTYSGKFFPFMELLPGEGYPIRFSRNLGQDYSSAGTGSTSDDYLHLIANTAACKVRLEVFPR